MTRHQALVLASARAFCEPCGSTGAMTLVRHWLDTEAPEPRQVRCPHCSYPWLPISTYYPSRRPT